MSVKTEKIGNSLLKEISEILRFEARDEDLKEVDLTYVKATGDLEYAKIYYTILDRAKRDKIQMALDKAAGYIRSQLAQRVELRHIPELKFVYDEALDYGEKIEHILEEIKN